MENGWQQNDPKLERTMRWLVPEQWPPHRPKTLSAPADGYYPPGTDTAERWLFGNYTYGVGGVCEVYDPPGGYLCSSASQGGGYGWDSEGPFFPGGFEWKSSTPFKHGWNLSNAELMAWPNGEGTVGYGVTSASVGRRETTLRWDGVASAQARSTSGRGRAGSRINGGWQTGRSYQLRGDPTPDPKRSDPFDFDAAGPWYVRGIGVLDQDEEWSWDATERVFFSRHLGARRRRAPRDALPI